MCIYCMYIDVHVLYLLFHQEEVTGIFAKITQLHQQGHNSCVIGDEIFVHSSDIVAIVSAPPVIFHQDLSPLTQEVHTIIIF